MSEKSRELIRTVGLGGLVLMCINGVVGSGVFLLPSESFKLLGPFSLWAPLLFSIPVFILVLCFAEASSHFDQPGGAFLYSKTAFGSFIGFETGWMNTLARVTSLAALSNGFVVSLARLYPAVGTGTPRAALIILTIVTFATIHSLGIKFGAGTIYLFTWGKMIPLIIFIVVVLIAFPTNPFPASFTLPGPGTDWSEAALLLLFAYAGFENLGVPAGEFRNPKREVPLALLAGIVAIAIVYVLSQIAALSALPDLGSTETPIADAMAMILGYPGAVLITVGAIISILGTNIGTMLEGSRMIFALADDEDRAPGVAWIHPRFRTPIVAIVLLSATAMVAALAGSFAKLAALSAVARMTTYLFTCMAIPKLRQRGGEGFRIPGGLTVPILGMLISVTLFATLKQRHLVAAVIALSVGAILYWIAKVRNGRPAAA